MLGKAAGSSLSPAGSVAVSQAVPGSRLPSVMGWV